MTDMCREFATSRKTGYELFDRYKEHGPGTSIDSWRRPVHCANQLPQQPEMLITQLKAEKPKLGSTQDPRTPDAAARRRRPSTGQKRLAIDA